MQDIIEYAKQERLRKTVVQDESQGLVTDSLIEESQQSIYTVNQSIAASQVNLAQDRS